MDWWIPILIAVLLISLVMLAMTLVAVCLWIYNNIPFRYVRLNQDAVNFIDELQKDIYKEDI
jgi:hypothetical protein